GGVGHRVHGGETAAGGGAGAGLDSLGLLAAGLAQVGVEVHEAGQDDAPVGLDDLRALGSLEIGAHGLDAAADQEHVADVLAVRAPAPEEQRGGSLRGGRGGGGGLSSHGG